MPTRKPSSAYVISAAFLFVLLVGYVGLYCYLIEPAPTSLGYSEPSYGYGEKPFKRYAWSGSKVARFFAPAHWIDRMIRPRVWGP